MAAVIQLKDIDDVLANLNYTNPNTQKYKLVRAVRQFYLSENSSDFPKEIDAADLVKALWDTGEDPALIKSKKKNLSSTKSAVNADLKKLYQEGGNPDGIIIGRSNIFDLSDEAKNKALTQLSESLKGEKEGIIGKIAEVLETINSYLSNPETLSEQGTDEGSKKLDGMKQLVLDLCRKIGLSAGEITGTGPEAGSGPSSMDAAIGNARKTQDGTGDIPEKTEIETVETLEAEDKAGVADIEVVESVDEDEELLTEDAIKAYEQEKAWDAAWQDFDLDDAVETDLSLENTFPEMEDDTIVETEAEETLEEADEILEEAVGSGVLDETQGITGDGPDANGSAEALGSGAGAIPGEGPDAGGGEGAPDDAVETDIALEEALPETDNLLAETEAEETLEEADEILEEAVDEEFQDEPQELIEDVIEDDLRSKAEFLSNLAEAAKILEKLGPDFNDSVYSEEEIKEKAKLLSEEFDRHLAIRDKFFNQHILIKGGTYTVGSKEPKDHEKLEQAIRLPAFYIGKFLVTNALFEIFIENTGYRTTAERCGYGLVYSARGRKEKDPRTGRERFVWKNFQEQKLVEGACWYYPSGPGSSIHDKRRHPVVQVSLEDARAFAAWTGKRIPTESEWEAASRTHFGYLYPWGNEWKEKACNVEKGYVGDTTPVDQYLGCCNGAGLADTLGNVLEWTLDAWTNTDTGEKDLQYYITKGGSWISNGSLSLPSRFKIKKTATSNILGFRCVAI